MTDHTTRRTLLLGGMGALLSACAGPNIAGAPVEELDPRTRGPVAGVGIEQQDVTAMTDRMVRDLLATPTFGAAPRPPQVTIDSEAFRNESSQRINVNLITTRLRHELNRAARGRIVFVGRETIDLVERERALKRQGRTDVGTLGLTRATAGLDYRLTGTITSLDSRSARTGAIQRFTQISFEMQDMERGTIVWSGLYEIARAAADDIVYR